MSFSYISVCSGIEAATQALHPLGWSPLAFAEIDPFASAVLAHHHGSNMPGEPLGGFDARTGNTRRAPNGVPNHGDFTAMDLSRFGQVDVLIGGTPCQAFSIAGQRQSLADARGNLTLAYVVLAHELARSHGLRNAWWENVPGVLSTADNAFGCFLGALVGADAPVIPPDGQRWPCVGMVSGPAGRAAWRVLDAQYFGLAQRRKRVFVVADFGNGADPAAVLFERQGLRGHPPARGEARQDAAADAAGGAGKRGGAPRTGRETRKANGYAGANSVEAAAVPGYAIGFGGGRTSGPIEQAATLTANGGGQAMDFEVETFLVETAPTLPSRASAGGGLGTDHDLDGGLIAHALRGEGFDASEDGTGRGTPIVPVLAQTLTRGAESRGKGGYAGRRQEDDANIVAYRTTGNDGAYETGDRVDALTTTTAPNAHVLAYAIQERAVSENPDAGPQGAGFQADYAYTLEARNKVQMVATRWAVRRLTPLECSRLQGFPDDHARIPWRGKPAEQCPDGPQYKTYGNSMAVNVMAWIGARLDAELRKRA
jgi:DNA (cytosine-5)-methyltransferase 1